MTEPVSIAGTHILKIKKSGKMTIGSVTGLERSPVRVVTVIGDYEKKTKAKESQYET